MSIIMQRYAILLILSMSFHVAAAFAPLHQQHHVGSSSSSTTTMMRSSVLVVPRMAADDNEDSNKDQEQPSTTTTTTTTTTTDQNRYDVSKLVSGNAGGTAGDDGTAGFNQFDPVLSATGFLSRRFGILGGLAVFAALFVVEGGEILKALDGADAIAGSGETVTTPSGLQITELLVGKGGGTVPLPGYVIGLSAKVSIGDKVIYDTTGDNKPIAFKYGQRPFQNVICEGVEEGIKGMKVGGKRILNVPSSLAPPGVELPPGVPLIYEVELTEVLSGYF